ncbi:MAG: hypothetical protein JWQ23_4425 [Herminiimonas sp.]|nr:hypothetical protein [Herminiimonas sp.]
MKIARMLSTAAVFLASLLAGTAHAVTLTLDELPYRNPAQLEAMMRMDDARYQDMLTNRWDQVEKILFRYIPDGVELFPVALGFYGPWKSCLQTHSILACREHMTLLIGLEKSKAKKYQQAPRANPFQ